MTPEEFRNMVEAKTRESMELTDALLNWFKSQEADVNISICALSELLGTIFAREINKDKFAGNLKLSMTMEMIYRIANSGAKPHAN